MEIARVTVSGVAATAQLMHEIPCGLTGASVTLEYTDEIWAGLIKNVYFVGVKDVAILNAGDTVYLPTEVINFPNVNVKIGICGIDGDQNIAIPTLWADLGTVRPAAPLNLGAPPQLPIWAQLMAMIGNLRELDTEAKNNLVAAINEVFAKASEECELTEDIQKAIDEALQEAKDSGEFDGKAPTITLYQTDKGVDIEVISADGAAQTAFIPNGKDGKGDTITLNPVAVGADEDMKTGVQIIITHADGTTETYTVYDGQTSKGDSITLNPVVVGEGEDMKTGVQIIVTKPDGSSESYVVYDGKNGKSAYEYAKDNGFTGTEADFTRLQIPAYTEADYGKVLSATANGLAWVAQQAGEVLTDAEGVAF